MFFSSIRQSSGTNSTHQRACATHRTAPRVVALLLLAGLALPLAACRARSDQPSPDLPAAPLPTAVDLEAIPYETRIAQDRAALEGACARLTESLTELAADSTRLEDPLWPIELETSAIEAWASTLVILARNNVPEQWAELHAALLDPARVVNAAAERIAYPDESEPPRTATTLLALRPAFAESCATLVEMAQPIGAAR